MTETPMNPPDRPAGCGWAWLIGAGIAVGVGYVCVRLVLDVFSAPGIAYTLGFGDGKALMWPEMTAVLTWLLLIETCALGGVVTNFARDQRRDSWLARWAFGHVTFAGWICGALAWACRALYHGGQSLLGRSRRVLSNMPVDSAAVDDFAEFEPLNLDAEFG